MVLRLDEDDPTSPFVAGTEDIEIEDVFEFETVRWPTNPTLSSASDLTVVLHGRIVRVRTKSSDRSSTVVGSLAVSSTFST